MYAKETDLKTKPAVEPGNIAHLTDPVARAESKLSEQVLIALRRIIRAIDLHSRFLARRYQLTGPQLVVLQRIIEHGEMSGSRLAKEVSLSHGTITGILGRLEARGLISRRRSRSDKRRFLLRATEQGLELVNQAPPLLQESFSAQFGQLQEWEQTQILSSLQRLVSMMEAQQLDASPILTLGTIDGQGLETAAEPTERPPDHGQKGEPSS